MPLIAPPPPRIDQRELEELVDELHALIEEARRRARRRRRFVAALVVAALAAGAAALLHGGGYEATFGRAVADASSSPAAAVPSADAWGPSHGPDGAFVVSIASAPDALYAGTIGSGIFRSRDGGRSWRPLAAGLPAALRVDALAVDPVRPRTVYAGTAEGVFKTTNAGRSWRRASRGLFQGRPPDGRRHRLVEGYVYAVVIDPRHPETIYASTWTDTYRSLDGARTWHRFTLPGGPAVSQVAFAREEPVAYAELTEPNGSIRFSRSTDGGDTWSLLSLRRPRYTAGVLAIDPHDARTVYLPIAHRGLLKSSDAGATWQHVYDREVVGLALDQSGTVYLAANKGLLASRNGGASWHRFTIDIRRDEGVWLLAADPYRPGAVYAASIGRLFRSVDGAATWAEATRGLRASRVGGLVASGSDLYAATGGGLFRSGDGGATWHRLETAATPSAVAADPAHAQTVYIGTRASGVFRSDNRGRTWNALTNGLTRRGIDALAVEENGRLYAATFGGIFASGDRGRSWQSTPVTAKTLALTTADGTVYGATVNGGVWRTDDGRGWTRQGHVCCGRIDALAADPADPDLVYAGNGSGIFRSDDGGAEWHHVGPAVPVQALAVDPEAPGTVYAGTWGGAGAYRSTDGGITWRPFAGGLPRGAVGGTSMSAGIGSLALSPDGKWLFAGTLGNGVVRRVIRAAG